MKKILLANVVLTAFLGVSSVFASEPIFEVMIKNHQFEPNRIEIPANQKVKLHIKNMDKTAEEFESHTLKREKIIKGNSEAFIIVGPLTPGEYPFEGEFNPKTAQGVVVAK
jgi:hypothetical protein